MSGSSNVYGVLTSFTSSWSSSPRLEKTTGGITVSSRKYYFNATMIDCVSPP